MARSIRTIHSAYLAYAATLVLAGFASLLVATAWGTPTALGDVLAGGWIFAGIAWIVGAFLLAPNVSTYLGPGGLPVRGGSPPVLYPAFTIPERNPQVMADLGEKLSHGTDLAALLAILGVLLLAAGALASVDVWLGVAAGGALLLLVATLSGASYIRPGPRAR